MTLPQVNLNGTSRAALIEQRLDACAALRQAMHALQEITPHSRDYQTARAGMYEEARALFAERYNNLRALHDNLMDEAIQLRDGGQS